MAHVVEPDRWEAGGLDLVGKRLGDALAKLGVVGDNDDATNGELTPPG